MTQPAYSGFVGHAGTLRLSITIGTFMAEPRREMIKGHTFDTLSASGSGKTHHESVSRKHLAPEPALRECIFCMARGN